MSARALLAAFCGVLRKKCGGNRENVAEIAHGPLSSPYHIYKVQILDGYVTISVSSMCRTGRRVLTYVIYSDCTLYKFQYWSNCDARYFCSMTATRAHRAKKCWKPIINHQPSIVNRQSSTITKPYSSSHALQALKRGFRWVWCRKHYTILRAICLRRPTRHIAWSIVLTFGLSYPRTMDGEIRSIVSLKSTLRGWASCCCRAEDGLCPSLHD
jgi:hypothetical protein